MQEIDSREKKIGAIMDIVGEMTREQMDEFCDYLQHINISMPEGTDITR